MAVADESVLEVREDFAEGFNGLLLGRMGRAEIDGFSSSLLVLD